MATPRQNNRIATRQIGIIKMAQHQLGMDDTTYRDLLRNEFNGKTSCKELTATQANRLIDIFQEKGFILKPKKKGWNSAAPHPGERRTTKKGRNVVSMASRAELSKVAVVGSLINWKKENGQELFLEKRVGLKGGKVRTSQDAYKAIEALKKAFENGMKKFYGPDWWAMTFEDERIMDYIERHKPEEFK